MSDTPDPIPEKAATLEEWLRMVRGADVTEQELEEARRLDAEPRPHEAQGEAIHAARAELFGKLDAVAREHPRPPSLQDLDRPSGMALSLGAVLELHHLAHRAFRMQEERDRKAAVAQRLRAAQAVYRETGDARAALRAAEITGRPGRPAEDDRALVEEYVWRTCHALDKLVQARAWEDPAQHWKLNDATDPSACARWGSERHTPAEAVVAIAKRLGLSPSTILNRLIAARDVLRAERERLTERAESGDEHAARKLESLPSADFEIPSKTTLDRL